MTDSSEGQPDRFGDPVEPAQDEGSLLFDFGAPDEPLNEDDFYHEEPPSRDLPIGWIVAGVLTFTVLGGLQLLGGASEPDDIDDAPVIVAPLPVDTTSRAALLPLPSDSVAGEVGSLARLALRAVGRDGRPEADTLVHFIVDSGEGRLENAEVATSSDGIAVNFIRLPETPGVTHVTASLPGSVLTPLQFKAVAKAGAPASVARVSGDGQEAEVGRLLPDRAAVRVLDAGGNPVPEALVTFQVASGDGIAAPSQARTDSLGEASALWRLGPIEGEQTLTARVLDVDRDIVFTATATPTATLEINNPTPSETSPVRVERNSFALGAGHACALRAESLVCRGTNDRGQAAPSGALGFVTVVSGSSHSCALNASGTAMCWGANEEGQLGNATRADRATPTRVDSELRFSTLAAGESHTCGLAGNGVPLCWGENLSGQLGDGSRNNQTVPRVVGGGLAFQEITAGWSHTCGLTSSGNTFCWGNNNQGQLGDGTTLDRLQPNLVSEAVGELVAGSAHTCGIRGGTVVCWGANSAGQLGDGSGTDQRTPVEVAGLPGPARTLAAGAVHTCALLVDGRVYCWGQNRFGQLGDGTNIDRAQPVEVGGDLRFREIHAGGASTCGFTGDGIEYCWGLNQSGQLGDGTRVNRSSPTRVTN